jgi:hypothetical protein
MNSLTKCSTSAGGTSLSKATKGNNSLGDLDIFSVDGAAVSLGAAIRAAGTRLAGTGAAPRCSATPGPGSTRSITLSALGPELRASEPPFARAEVESSAVAAPPVVCFYVSIDLLSTSNMEAMLSPVLSRT